MNRIDNDDIVFGSIFTLIAATISGIICFCGNKNEIIWLSIVGIIFTAISLLISLIPSKVGVIASIILVIVCLSGRIWFINSDNVVLSWLYVKETVINLLFVTRVAVLVCVELVIVSVINLFK